MGGAGIHERKASTPEIPILKIRCRPRVRKGINNVQNNNRDMARATGAGSDGSRLRESSR